MEKITWTDNPLSEMIKTIVWPIKTVTVATPSTPKPVTGMVWICYDAMTAQTVQIAGEIEATGMSRIADTYHHLLSCPSPEELQGWVSELGWVLGSGYMYRWHHAPGRRMEHLWGLERYAVAGEAMQEGDNSKELAALCAQYGVWSWEINCAYGKRNGMSAMMMDSWIHHDPSLQEDGSRAGYFPGWDGAHPWLQAQETGSGYESQYYYARPKRYSANKDVLRIGI